MANDEHGGEVGCACPGCIILDAALDKIKGDPAKILALVQAARGENAPQEVFDAMVQGLVARQHDSADTPQEPYEMLVQCAAMIAYSKVLRDRMPKMFHKLIMPLANHLRDGAKLVDPFMPGEGGEVN